MRRHHPDSAALPGAAWQLLVLVVVTLAVPLVIRMAIARYAQEPGVPSYLPALEGPRTREPFNPEPIEVFAFAMQIYADFSAYTSLARGSARAAARDRSPTRLHLLSVLTTSP